MHLRSDSLLSKTDLTVQSLVSSEPACDNSREGGKPTSARGRALSDLLSQSFDQTSELPVLEPIRIQSLDIDSDESDEERGSGSGAEEEDSEPEADRRPENKGTLGGGRGVRWEELSCGWAGVMDIECIEGKSIFHKMLRQM